MGKKIIKTRNAGTMSEAAFWGFIRSALRKKSMYWKPIYDCKRNAKREYVGSNKRQKFEYQCNKCKNCISFNNNSNPDIIEIDAASNNGVDEIREIKNKINLVPTISKYKVYIIDEVHMLSK